MVLTTVIVRLTFIIVITISTFIFIVVKLNITIIIFYSRRFHNNLAIGMAFISAIFETMTDVFRVCSSLSV